jgi:hypothetical protein
MMGFSFSASVDRDVEAATRDRLHPLQQGRMQLWRFTTKDRDLDGRLTLDPASGGGDELHEHELDPADLKLVQADSPIPRHQPDHLATMSQPPQQGDQVKLDDQQT